MIARFPISTALVTGFAVFMMVAHANASTIIYSTGSPDTGFVLGNIGINSETLDSSSGQAATLVFTPNASSATGVPSNINFGVFELLCPACSGEQTSDFQAFTFDLVITDTTDNASGEFVGTSNGGMVSSNSSMIDITWVPLQLGPGTSNASTGNFGTTIFSNGGSTAIVAPNSGNPAGDTTVQGTISTAPMPEPATIPLIGGGLIAVSLAGREKRRRIGGLAFSCPSSKPSV